MGEPTLEWSEVQLRMANQQKVIPLGKLSKLMVDIARVKALVDFEFIQTVEDFNPYPALLGLDWAITMGGIINLKKRKMIFKNTWKYVIIPLDPTEGDSYIETVHEGEEIDSFYKLST